ncbi:hypothetical protein RI367_004560 [Sorochytrium milnesiophthora]
MSSMLPPPTTLAQLPIAQVLKAKLFKAGFRTLRDVRDLTVQDLAQELSISPQQASDIIRAAAIGRGTAQVENAVAIERRPRQCLTTGTPALDLRLGGEGLPLGSLVELAGVTGIGRTALCMQLCVNVQLPQQEGGCSGQAIYIDTEGALTTHRLNALIDTCKHRATDYADTGDAAALLLQNILVYRLHSPLEVSAVCYLLPEILVKHREIKLVVFDSLTFLFRDTETSGSDMRTKFLPVLLQRLRRFAEEQNIVVIVTNQLHLRSSAPDDSSLLMADDPGTRSDIENDSAYAACSHRFEMYWRGDQR